jgi:ubiquinone/menaquinone biosynthesis C-methylase UbiE
MKRQIIITTMLFCFSLLNGQNQNEELKQLLIQKEILEKKIALLELELNEKEDNPVDKQSIDFKMIEFLIDQETIWIEKLVSGDYFDKYQDLMEKIRTSPNTKKLESAIVRRIEEMKMEMKAEIEKMPIGDN